MFCRSLSFENIINHLYSSWPLLLHSTTVGALNLISLDHFWKLSLKIHYLCICICEYKVYLYYSKISKDCVIMKKRFFKSLNLQPIHCRTGSCHTTKTFEGLECCIQWHHFTCPAATHIILFCQTLLWLTPLPSLLSTVLEHKTPKVLQYQRVSVWILSTLSIPAARLAWILHPQPHLPQTSHVNTVAESNTW